MSLVYPDFGDPPSVLSPHAAEENGADVHSGATETSRTLFLQPQLVHRDFEQAIPYTAASVQDLVNVAESPGWLGYFGSPRAATAGAGAQLVAFRTVQVAELALKILDGFDWRGLSTWGDRGSLNSSFRTLDQNLLARSQQERIAQEAWIRGRR